ncbi:MAG: hypothetical protein JWM27_2236 [Gemmatimonadetes bacterium]|nr:hypothetical protein [Gemmatimonadota bacterium]
MTTTLKTLALTVATGLSLAACAGNATPADGPRTLPANDRENTFVSVENRSWSDMNVYAVEGGMRYRLGTVTSMNTTRLRLPVRTGAFTHDVQLIAVPIGAGEQFVSPSMQVSYGQRLAFTIQNHLAISSVAVFNR